VLLHHLTQPAEKANRLGGGTPYEDHMTTQTGSPYIRDLSNLTLRDLSADDVAYCHLSRRGWEQIKGCTVYTTLDDIETEMRQSQGIVNTSSYVPLLAGFSILEQLGSTYRNRKMKRHPTSGGGIEHALYYFCGYPPMSPEVKALYALRNGLIHAASLTSSDQGSGARYIFRYDYNMQTAIQTAQVAWDGQFSTIDRAVMTLVNPRKLTDQVSEAIALVRGLFFHDRDNLRILRTPGQIIADHLIWR
jgi:hypothetical protein